MRGRAWQYLCGAHEMLLQNKGVFDVRHPVIQCCVVIEVIYLAQDLIHRPEPDIVVNVIDKDLDRTFPSHVLFAKAGSQGLV